MTLSFPNRTAYWVLFPTLVATYGGFLVNLLFGENFPLSLFMLAFGLSVIGLSLLLVAKKVSHITLTGLEIPILLLFSVIFFSGIHSPDTQYAFVSALRVLGLAVCSFLIWNSIRNLIEIRFYLQFLMLIAIGLGLYAIVSFILNPQDLVWAVSSGSDTLKERISGVEKDPNIFATLFYLPYIASLISITSADRLSLKPLALVALFFSAVSIVLTYSRSGYIIIAFITLLILHRHNKHYLIFFGVLSVLVAALFYEPIRLALSVAIQRMYNLFFGELDTSNSVRIMLFEGAMEMISSSPLLGVGFKGFADAFLMYFDKVDTAGVILPHNVYYEVWSEIGLIGLILFLIVFFVPLFRIRRHLQTKKLEVRIVTESLYYGYMSLLIFYLVYGGGLFDNKMWISLGLMLALDRVLSSPSREAEVNFSKQRILFS